MRTQTIEPFYPIWCPAFRGHSPVDGHFLKETPAVPLEVELSPIYRVSRFIKPINPETPNAGGLLNIIA